MAVGLLLTGKDVGKETHSNVTAPPFPPQSTALETTCPFDEET